MDVFSQKMTVVNDHLMSNEPSHALNEINQLLSKKKSFEKLTEKQKTFILLVKASCLVRLNCYGEAKQLLDKFLVDYKEWDTDAQLYSRMLISLAIYLSRNYSSIEKTTEVKKYYEEFYKKNAEKDKIRDDYLVLCIADWDLTSVQNLYMKSFKSTNLAKDYLGRLE
jgi:hypothetical protein